MAKFYGAVGYETQTETSPGVWQGIVQEYMYCGDILRISRKYQTSDQVNDDLSVNNEVSIIADPFAMRNFAYIKYANWMGVNWKVSSVTVQYPRLILTLGGVYNGEVAST